MCCDRWAWGVKKCLHVAERDTKVNLNRCEEFLATVAAIPPEKMIFLDESGVTTTMTRQWGRAPKGERIHAASTIESATVGQVFKAYVEQVLCIQLRQGDVVVMDNLSAHKVAGIRQLIGSSGAQLLYPPPYSPDLNPIEKAWSKFKKFLRDAKARSKEALDQAVTGALQTIAPDNAAAWFRHCSYQGTAIMGSL